MPTRTKRIFAGAMGLLGLSVFVAQSENVNGAHGTEEVSAPAGVFASAVSGTQCVPHEQNYRNNLGKMESDQEQVFTSGCGGLF